MKLHTMDTILYIIHMEGTSFYKIGTSRNMKRRLDNLRTANPFDLNVMYWRMFTDKQAKKMEKYLHNTYCEYNKKLEWFNLTEELLNSICNDVESYKE